MSLDMKALKEAAEKAGGREWFVDSKPTASGLAKVDDGTNGMFAIKAEWPEAQFIALANPSAILSLIERCEAMERVLREVKRRSGLLMHQNIGRWDMRIEHDKRSSDVTAGNIDIIDRALSKADATS